MRFLIYSLSKAFSASFYALIALALAWSSFAFANFSSGVKVL